ncbi:Cof-type HAD-IIB family hydrolase [Clostridium sp. DJ247]|uniref:Cof-type HAD-IIB family hydrolase n=1 Tax=Clostridium sp. DJ247 TaxID=2726188 RepID=UPI0016282F7D|nr:Cof-type HAD-IIB family hydrolase [Clostridium sp. DJ247]MBC2580797.1 HAD family phosphatase [Clostridium sp. DJ247]
MSYKLVCIDMDGTLLNSKRKITENTRSVLKNAHNNGVHIVITTGRIYDNAEYYSDLIGVKSPVIAANGAFIKEKDKDEIIYKSILGKKLSTKILNICSKYEAALEFHTSQKMYLGNKLDKSIINLLMQKTLLKEEKIEIIHVKNIEQWKTILHNEEENIVKCIISNRNEEELQKIRNEVEKLDDVEVVSSARDNIEITCKGTSKGRAVEILAGYYNLKREEIIAIGDSENDLSMIEYAGLGVAMGNAIDLVKRKANYITDTNDEEGVAKAVNKFIMNI